CGAAILPDNRAADGLARSPIPSQRGLALIRDANGRDAIRAEPGAGERFCGHARLSSPDLLRIVLHPARLREVLAEFLLGGSPHGSGLVEDNRAAARGPLIEGEDIAH